MKQFVNVIQYAEAARQAQSAGDNGSRHLPSVLIIRACIQLQQYDRASAELSQLSARLDELGEEVALVLTLIACDVSERSDCAEISMRCLDLLLQLHTRSSRGDADMSDAAPTSLTLRSLQLNPLTILADLIGLATAQHAALTSAATAAKKSKQRGEAKAGESVPMQIDSGGEQDQPSSEEAALVACEERLCHFFEQMQTEIDAAKQRQAAGEMEGDAEGESTLRDAIKSIPASV